MSLFEKVEAEVEIKASANRFHEVNSKRLAEVPKLSPNFLQRVDLVEGEWGQEGSVMCWYFLFGKSIKICCWSCLMDSWNIFTFYTILALTNVYVLDLLMIVLITWWEKSGIVLSCWVSWCFFIIFLKTKSDKNP